MNDIDSTVSRVLAAFSKVAPNAEDSSWSRMGRELVEDLLGLCALEGRELRDAVGAEVLPAAFTAARAFFT